MACGAKLGAREVTSARGRDVRVDGKQGAHLQRTLHARAATAEIPSDAGGNQESQKAAQAGSTAPSFGRGKKRRYLLRTNITDADPARLWEFYLQLNEVEQAFKELKGELALRPIYHQLESRIQGHIFVSFLAYCLQVTLKARLRRCAGGLTPRAVIEKFAAIQMLDVHQPTTDGREIVLSRYTQPEREVCLLWDQLNLTLPEQAPPKIHSPSKSSE